MKLQERYDNCLVHYGVLGMRWGVRKARFYGYTTGESRKSRRLKRKLLKATIRKASKTGIKKEDFKKRLLNERDTWDILSKVTNADDAKNEEYVNSIKKFLNDAKKHSKHPVMKKVIKESKDELRRLKTADKDLAKAMESDAATKLIAEYIMEERKNKLV